MARPVCEEAALEDQLQTELDVAGADLRRVNSPKGRIREIGDGIAEDDPVERILNFDAELEGNLKRANTEDFTRVAKGAEEVHSLEDDSWLGVLEQKPTDLSSGRWIYLLILLVLIFEQAMAVRLSYHNRPDELEMFAPSAAAAMTGRTALAGTEAAATETTGTAT